MDGRPIDRKEMCLLTLTLTHTHTHTLLQVLSKKRFGGEWWVGTESINISLVLIAIRSPALTYIHTYIYTHRHTHSKTHPDPEQAHMCTNSQTQQICSDFVNKHTHTLLQYWVVVKQPIVAQPASISVWINTESSPPLIISKDHSPLKNKHYKTNDRDAAATVLSGYRYSVTATVWAACFYLINSKPSVFTFLDADIYRIYFSLVSVYHLNVL